MAENTATHGSPLERSVGDLNKDVIANTTPVANKNYFCLHAMTDVVFTALADNKLVNGSFAGTTLAKGDRLFGDFTGLTLSSGTLVCYYR